LAVSYTTTNKGYEMKQFNEKPSQYANLGHDILGAQRHNFDTYESEQEKETKAKKKATTKHNKALKEKAIAEINEDNYQEVIIDYEFLRFANSIDGFDDLTAYSKESMNSIREYIQALPWDDNRNTLAKKYNSLCRKIRKVRWSVNDRNWKSYFDTKRHAFTEYNGIQRPWKNDSKFEPSIIEALKSKVGAVQFGNSLPDSEREYCMLNLNHAIDSLKKDLAFDFKKLGFSFGARGKAGSIAHYQNSAKVLAFNRGWDGAFIHELGHAIDYDLGLVSDKIPYDYKLAYREQLVDNKIAPTDYRYYSKPVEIFARLFEQYANKHFQCNSWMQVTYDSQIMPPLTSEIEAWMTQVLGPILREDTN
jgi:hypothetical protein